MNNRVLMRRTSSATLGLLLLTLVMLSFHFLFMRKPTPACPLFALEWHSRWPLCRVVKPSSFLLISPSPITSHLMFVSLSSSFSSWTCSSFDRVLTLYVAIFSISFCWCFFFFSPFFWLFFLPHGFLAPPACSLEPESPPRSETLMLLGTGGLGFFVLFMLVLIGLPLHAGQCGLERCRFSRRRLDHDTGRTGLHGTRIKQRA